MISKNIYFQENDNAVSGKTVKNIRKNQDIKLITTYRRRNQLVSEPNYHTTTVQKTY